MGELRADDDPMRFAVCVCTRNRPDCLARALASLQPADERLVQIVVSDDSEDEHVEANAAVTGGDPRVRLVRGPRRGLAANRNHCLRQLDETVHAVAFLDDDAGLRPGFLSTAEAEFRRHPSRTIVTGREYQDGIDVTPRNLSFWGHQELRPRDGTLHGICINATVFPREVFRLAAFDEELVYGSEEVDIAGQAEALGYRIIFVPELIVDHQPSQVDRAENARYIDASRLYATYKRYRWLERRPWKAAAYATLAPLHLVASMVKREGLAGIRDAASSISAARIKAQRFGNSGSSGTRPPGPGVEALSRPREF